MARRWVILAGLAAALVAAQASAAHPFETAMYANAGLADLARIPASGATAVRLPLSWPSVAPATEPASWDPTDPADPHYDWSAFDPLVRDATSRGLHIFITIGGAPAWAQGQPAVKDPLLARTPDPADFGAFAHAVAERYSGSFQGLPRVRWFQAWNEPNISLSLVPQLVGGKPAVVDDYRLMLNAFARAVHSVHPDNLVIMGGLAPFRDVTPSVTAQDPDWGPLSFLRALLCVSKTGRSTCSTRVDFDVFATHPYTSGGPTHRAVLPNDVSLGDLPKERAVLAAAARAGHLVRPNPAFWVTEFSWDSRPPDPQGVPSAVLSRWVADALYRMWADGVSLVTWFQVRDQPFATSYYQSGLWYLSGKQKPALRAFRFPFLALPRGGRVFVWGRTPAGGQGRVAVEWSGGGAWRKVATLVPDRYGVFHALLRAPVHGRLRARVSGEASLPFALTPVPDLRVNPFGSAAPLQPKSPR